MTDHANHMPMKNSGLALLQGWAARVLFKVRQRVAFRALLVVSTTFVAIGAMLSYALVRSWLG